MSHTFYWNRRPSIRNCGGVGGCTTEFSGESEPEKNTSYIGEGFYQRISTHHAHQQFDWVIRDNLLNHSTVAYDRWFMGGNSLSAGADWPQTLWGANQGGLVDTTAGPPVMTFGGNTPYSAVGQNWTRFGFLVNNRWQFSNDLTWVKGRHTLKTGFEFRHHDFPFRGWGAGDGRTVQLQPAGHRRATTRPGNNLGATGDPFASFLLGQVQDASQTIPVHPTFNEAYTAALGQRRVQGQRQPDADARDALRLPVRPHGDRRSVLDVRSQHAEPRRPAAFPARLIFAGSGPGRVRATDVREPEVGRAGARGSASPIGWATSRRSAAATGSTTPASPSTSSSASRRSASQANLLAPNTTNGQSPAFYLDNGFPQDRVARPPFINPAFANGSNVDRRAAGRPDAAALPELVGDLPAPAHRQHDAGRVLHRQPRHAAEPPLRRRSASTPT